MPIISILIPKTGCLDIRFPSKFTSHQKIVAAVAAKRNSTQQLQPITVNIYMHSCETATLVPIAGTAMRHNKTAQADLPPPCFPATP